MRIAVVAVGLAVLGVVPARAQDSALDDGERAGVLRQAIVDRFSARVQEELGLNEQQASRMRDVVGSYFVKRRGMETDERRLRQAMAAELRPGVAANKEQVARLTDQLLALRIRYAQSYRDEVKDLSGFLDPVQVAQYLILRERLLDRIREIQQSRQDQAPLRRRRAIQP